MRRITRYVSRKPEHISQLKDTRCNPLCIAALPKVCVSLRNTRGSCAASPVGCGLSPRFLSLHHRKRAINLVVRTFRGGCPIPSSRFSPLCARFPRYYLLRELCGTRYHSGNLIGVLAYYSPALAGRQSDCITRGADVSRIHPDPVPLYLSMFTHAPYKCNKFI